MSVNWQRDPTAWFADPSPDDFDDYGRGEGHAISIGDEIESSDKHGSTHAGVVVGIIRDIYHEPVCYKVWNEDRDTFDYVQASDSIMCEPCGSSQWSLERIGYTRYEGFDGHGFYKNSKTWDVIEW